MDSALCLLVYSRLQKATNLERILNVKRISLPFQLPIRQSFFDPFVDIKQLSGFITTLGINNVINQL